MTKPVFVERRKESDYAVRHENSKSASAVASTQKEAIQKAKEM